MKDLLEQEIAAEAGIKPAWRWSPLQEAVFEACRNDPDNLGIEAVAGAAKTTTIVAATEYTKGPQVFLAFNKSISEDIRPRLKGGARASTFNALGHRIWMMERAGAIFDMDKLEKIMERCKIEGKYRYLIKRAVGAAKSSGQVDIPINSFEKILGATLELDDDELGIVSSYAYSIFNQSNADIKTFDFDDQVFGPIIHDWKFPAFETIFVDERQDLNGVQHAFLGRLAGLNGRVISVGDRNQAIYAFRGALTNSTDLLNEQFEMKELPLSITYRCPLLVVEEAQKIVPHIQARDGAPSGNIIYLTESDEEFKDSTHLVICRTNAPLLREVMRYVRARVPCRVLSNVLEGLGTFIRRLKPYDIRDLITKVRRWESREIFAAESKGMDWKVAAIQDKASTLEALCEGFQTVEEVLNLIVQLSKGTNGPIFATIHKAKGLEADNVTILRPDLLCPWWAKSEEEKQQELNLKYVAITRAKQTLTWGVPG